jgi:hypothetical protein
MRHDFAAFRRGTLLRLRTAALRIKRLSRASEIFERESLFALLRLAFSTIAVRERAKNSLD